jgi:hypothetical protein
LQIGALAAADQCNEEDERTKRDKPCRPQQMK